MGNQVKGHSPKKIKSLTEVPHLAHLNVHVLSFNINLSRLRSVFLDRVIHFSKKLGDQEKGRSTRKLKSLIEVPYIAHLKVQVLIFNMNLFSSQ